MNTLIKYKCTESTDNFLTIAIYFFGGPFCKCGECIAYFITVLITNWEYLLTKFIAISISKFCIEYCYINFLLGYNGMT